MRQTGTYQTLGKLNSFIPHKLPPSEPNCVEITFEEYPKYHIIQPEEFSPQEMQDLANQIAAFYYDLDLSDWAQQIRATL